jgi:hypothetical protein
MPLLALWKSNPSAIGESTIEQLVAIAGDGNLRDGSTCSTELREYFKQVPSSTLQGYVDHCLTVGFAKSGLVLQDLINELGRRLDYQVEDGRYQGTTNAIGYDGIWRSPEGHFLIVEVKTTDSFRVSLDTIANYRERLFDQQRISTSSSILIVVGRHQTGELEAQIRGSRHAWDVRLISIDALSKLVQLKENSDSADTGQKIRGVLVPAEYTRLDNLIDVMFTAATDVETTIVEVSARSEITAEPSNDEATGSGWQFTDFRLLDAKRQQIVDTLARRLGETLIKKSRALFWNADHGKRAACSISKRYLGRSTYPYWYAYHPQWDDFLGGGDEGYFILGCMDLDVAYAIPLPVMRANLAWLNTTTTSRSTYWHIHLVEIDNGEHALALPKKQGQLSLAEYKLPLTSVI